MSVQINGNANLNYKLYQKVKPNPLSFKSTDYNFISKDWQMHTMNNLTETDEQMSYCYMTNLTHCGLETT